jgi:hypothetical protein
MKAILFRAAILVAVTTVPISAAVVIHDINSIPLPSSSTVSFNGNAFSITNTDTTVAANAVNGISDGVGASGVFGENLGTKGFGVYGYVTAPGSTGVAGIGGTSGDGVYGKGGTNGVHGISKLGQAGKFELTGTTNSHTALVATTAGTGSAGSFTAPSFSTTADALSGLTNGGGAGVIGTSNFGDGVVGFSNSPPTSGAFGVGVRGKVSSIFATGVEGDGGSAGTGVFGQGDTGVDASGGSTGVFATAGSSGDGVQAAGYFGVRASGAGLNSSSFFADCDTQGFVMIAQNGGGHVMSIDCAGNAIFKGSVTQFGSPKAITHGSDGRAVVAYAPRVSRPTIEDVGEAQLRNGEAYVSLDPTFAQTIDARAGYLVFITPSGESRGLYTTHKSPSGFLVRENAGGRSTIAFDYRIVAKPYDSNAARLPAYAPPSMHVRPPHHARRVSKHA